MISTAFPVDIAPDTPSCYGLIRALLRVWFRLVFRRIRLLQAVRRPHSGPVLLVVNCPFRLIHACAVIAALDRNVRCMAERKYTHGWVRRRLSRALGMISYDYDGDDWPAVAEAASDLIGHGGAAVVFARQQPAGSEESACFAPEAAEIALEAQGRLGREVALPVHPLHVFWPTPQSKSKELLLHLDAPVAVNLALLEEGDFGRQLKGMDSEIELACHRNPFRLRPETVGHFITGLEGVMREDLAEAWSKRPRWKQSVDELELSPFLVKLTHWINDSHPAGLAVLCQEVAAYQDAKRRAALGRFTTETAGKWFQRQPRRLTAWLEAIAGFPIACYGLANVLPAWLVLKVTGLMRKGLWQATPREWATRVLVAFGCYAIQIALAAHFLARWEAGIYAPSILFCGAYALRYIWFSERRAPVLLQSVAQGSRSARPGRLRRQLIEQLKREQDRFASLWNVAH
ncbi:MAG: hypothetical protein ACRD10_04660 [Terriglobia bacterium]